MAEKCGEYVPPDAASIDVKDPCAMRFWASAFETPEDKLMQAVLKVGPMVDQVKKELGIAGV
jgi:hypothetical protein